MSETAHVVDYRAVKKEVSMLQILERYHLVGRLQRKGDSLTGCCPLHRGRDATQFRVSVSKNFWSCSGDCKRGGTIIDFVALKERVDLREATLLIQCWFAVPVTLPERQSKAEPSTTTGSTER